MLLDILGCSYISIIEDSVGALLHSPAEVAASTAFRHRVDIHVLLDALARTQFTALELAKHVSLTGLVAICGCAFLRYCSRLDFSRNFTRYLLLIPIHVLTRAYRALLNMA